MCEYDIPAMIHVSAHATIVSTQRVRHIWVPIRLASAANDSDGFKDFPELKNHHSMVRCVLPLDGSA